MEPGGSLLRSPLPNLSQINPMDGLPTNFFKINLNIVLSSTRMPSSQSLSLRIPLQIPLRTSPLPHTQDMMIHTC